VRVLGKPIEHEHSLADLLRRPGVGYQDLMGLDGGRYQNPQLSADLASGGVSHETALAVVEQVEIAAKYAGYIDRQRDEVGRAAHFENMPLPADLDYAQVSALSMEVRQKLNRHKPETLGQASRISGVTPAAISLLLIHLRRGRFSGFAPEPAEAAP
jgi:tRNA uridine 5-carboxymethylaminomethyl modification enzyme